MSMDLKVRFHEYGSEGALLLCALSVVGRVAVTCAYSHSHKSPHGVGIPLAGYH